MRTRAKNILALLLVIAMAMSMSLTVVFATDGEPADSGAATTVTQSVDEEDAATGDLAVADESSAADNAADIDVRYRRAMTRYFVVGGVVILAGIATIVVAKKGKTRRR